VGKKIILLEALGVTLILSFTMLHSYVQEDVWFWDEAFYLARGIDPTTFGFPTWADSPGHSALYALIQRIVDDPISAYLIGRGIQATAFVACVWIASRLLLKPVYALTAAAIVSIVPITYGWPGVSNIASGLILIVVVLLFKKTNQYTFGLSAMLLWIASSSRPELTYVALITSLISITWLYWAWQKKKISIHPSAAALTFVGALILPLLLSLRYGNIFRRFEREWTAFSQHYGIRNSTSGLDTWISGSDAVYKDFPKSNSIIQAAIENPSSMMAHLLKNLLLAPLSFIGNSLGFNAEQLTEITIPKIGLLGFFILALTLCLINLPSCISVLKNSVRQVIQQSRRVGALLAILVFLSSSISILVIYPRAHYQLVSVGLMTIAVLFLLQRLSLHSWVSQSPLAWAAIAFTLVSFQTLINLPGRVDNAPRIEASLREINQELKSVRILARDEPITVFLNESSKVEVPPGATNFDEAIRTSGANVIYRSTILDESDWGLLYGYSAFFENPEDFGFSPVIPGSPFLVNKD